MKHTPRLTMSAEGEKAISIQADLAPVVGQVFLYQVKWKSIMPCWNWGVCGKDSRSPNFSNCFVKCFAVRHKFA
jgi:hypothetical protein